MNKLTLSALLAALYIFNTACGDRPFVMGDARIAYAHLRIMRRGRITHAHLRQPSHITALKALAQEAALRAQKRDSHSTPTTPKLPRTKSLPNMEITYAQQDLIPTDPSQQVHTPWAFIFAHDNMIFSNQ